MFLLGEGGVEGIFSSKMENVYKFIQVFSSFVYQLSLILVKICTSKETPISPQKIANLNWNLTKNLLAIFRTLNIFF